MSIPQHRLGELSSYIYTKQWKATTIFQHRNDNERSHITSDAGKSTPSQHWLCHMVRFLERLPHIHSRLNFASKQRHIKCDERKPWCRKCAAACLTCGGYEIKTRKPRALGSRFRPRSPYQQPQIPLTTPLVMEPFDEDGSRELFHHARTCIIKDLEIALSPVDFWYDYALPLSHSIHAVKHAICALGGAHRIFMLRYHMADSIPQRLQASSLRQYNLAMHSVRELIDAASESDIAVVLTCCVIFIALENLFGHYTSSVQHMRSGSSLLVSLLRGLSPSQPPPKILDDFAQTLCRLGDDVWGYIREMVAPELNIYSVVKGNPDRADMSFDSISEAEQGLHDITKLIEADRTVFDRKVMAWTQYGQSGTQREMRFLLPNTPPEHSNISFDTLRRRFYIWNRAFDDLKDRIYHSQETQQVLLRTRTLAVDQALWAGWLRCNEWKDYQQDDLEKILERSEELVKMDTFKSRPVFTFDGSLILSIAMACVSTTDSDTRWRAIRLLRSFWMKEGIWDSLEVADILEAMVLALSRGMITKDTLPWDVPHLARLMDSLKLDHVRIPGGPLSLTRISCPTE